MDCNLTEFTMYLIFLINKKPIVKQKKYDTAHAGKDYVMSHGEQTGFGAIRICGCS